MKHSSSTVSIVIPVYNEEEQLAACLNAIARQKVPADEVIVVDNNSKDNTVKIARDFPFVRVLEEKRQGVVFARNRGFDAAKGTIIARIDADTHVPENWVQQLHSIFDTSDVDALSGAVEYYDMPARKLFSDIDLFFRRHLAKSLKNDNFLFGANMAIRRSAWMEVRSHVCTSAGMHEDFDLAIHLQEKDQKVTFDDRLFAGVSSRRIDTNLRDFYHYVVMSPQTYAKHNLTVQRHMYPVVWLILIHHLPLRLIKRSYNAETGSFSLVRLFTKTASRVDPTTHQA